VHSCCTGCGFAVESSVAGATPSYILFEKSASNQSDLKREKKKQKKHFRPD